MWRAEATLLHNGWDFGIFLSLGRREFVIFQKYLGLITRLLDTLCCIHLLLLLFCCLNEQWSISRQERGIGNSLILKVKIWKHKRIWPLNEWLSVVCVVYIRKFLTQHSSTPVLAGTKFLQGSVMPPRFAMAAQLSDENFSFHQVHTVDSHSSSFHTAAE